MLWCYGFPASGVWFYHEQGSIFSPLSALSTQGHYSTNSDFWSSRVIGGLYNWGAATAPKMWESAPVGPAFLSFSHLWVWLTFTGTCPVLPRLYFHLDLTSFWSNSLYLKIPWLSWTLGCLLTWEKIQPQSTSPTLFSYMNPLLQAKLNR